MSTRSRFCIDEGRRDLRNNCVPNRELQRQGRKDLSRMPHFYLQLTGEINFSTEAQKGNIPLEVMISNDNDKIPTPFEAPFTDS